MVPEEIRILGMKIRKLRFSNGWKQSRLAVEIDVDPAYISAIESSKKIPSLMTLYKVARIFDIRLYELFIDDGDFKKTKYKNKKIFEILKDSSPGNLNKFYKIAKVLRSK